MRRPRRVSSYGFGVVVGSAFGLQTFIAMLAETYAELARPGEGLSLVAEALAIGEQNESHYWDAELHRLKGTVTLLSESASRAAVARDAESSFLAALGIARRQNAKSFELRAAT